MATPEHVALLLELTGSLGGRCAADSIDIDTLLRRYWLSSPRAAAVKRELKSVRHSGFALFMHGGKKTVACAPDFLQLGADRL